MFQRFNLHTTKHVAMFDTLKFLKAAIVIGVICNCNQKSNNTFKIITIMIKQSVFEKIKVISVIKDTISICNSVTFLTNHILYVIS